VREALLATAETTAMIFVILLGAEVFNAFLALSQAPDLLALWISEQDFPPTACWRCCCSPTSSSAR
jgi:TRAP-type C4-dicarboxylate transport system permease large subunit